MVARSAVRYDETRGLLTRRNGTPLPVVYVSFPMVDSDGLVAGSVLMFTDIGDRLAWADGGLEQSERFVWALDAADTTAFDLNINTGDLVVSDNFERMNGLDPGTFSATFEGFLALVHPEDRHLVVWAATPDRPDGEFEYELRMLLPEGTVRWVRSRGRRVLDELGVPIRVSGVSVDITNRRSAEEAVRSAGEMLRTTVAGSPDAFVGIDDQGYITDWNPAAERLFGWSRGEAKGQVWRDSSFRSVTAPPISPPSRTSRSRQRGRRFRTRSSRSSPSSRRA